MLEHGQRPPDRGFTVIELVTVLLIVMILAGMVVPAVASGLRSSKLRGAASETATALRRARSMAISEGEMYRADMAGADMDRVRAGEIKVRDRPATIRIYPAPEFSLQTATSAGGAMLPAGINFTDDSTSDLAGGSLARLFFLPDGSAAVGSGDTLRPVEVVYFKPGASVPEKRRSKTTSLRFEITVRPLTGRIEVSELKD